jgi:hypothetical protein
MLNQDMADLFPAVAVGGPGVNAFTAQIYEELPVAYTLDERVFVQMNQPAGRRAAVWGMDPAATRAAAGAFVRDGYLDRFLDLVWHRHS